jgi:hypothetical protein
MKLAKAKWSTRDLYSEPMLAQVKAQISEQYAIEIESTKALMNQQLLAEKRRNRKALVMIKTHYRIAIDREPHFRSRYIMYSFDAQYIATALCIRKNETSDQRNFVQTFEQSTKNY